MIPTTPTASRRPDVDSAYALRPAKRFRLSPPPESNAIASTSASSSSSTFASLTRETLLEIIKDLQNSLKEVLSADKEKELKDAIQERDQEIAALRRQLVSVKKDAMAIVEVAQAFQAKHER